MKQIGAALLQYIQDYDECFPYSTADSSNWRQVILTYVNGSSATNTSWSNTALEICPDNPNSGTVLTGGGRTSYAANISGMHNGSTPYGLPGGWGILACQTNCTNCAQSPCPPLVLAQIAASSSLIAVVESLRYNDFDIDDSLGPGNGYCKVTGESYSPPWSCLFAGHTKMSNYLFCDGHVKTLAPSTTWNYWYYDNTPVATHANSTGLKNANSILQNAYGLNL